MRLLLGAGVTPPPGAHGGVDTFGALTGSEDQWLMMVAVVRLFHVDAIYADRSGVQLLKCPCQTEKES